MLPSPLPTLQDERVTLRPLVAADREPLYAVARDPELWAQHHCGDRYQRPVFDALIDDAIAGRGAFTLLDRKRNDRIIGSTRLRYLNATAMEIGWTFLDRAYWGTGYNGAMKKLLVDYLHDRRIDAVFYVNECNLRSQRAVGKLGADRLTDPADPVVTDRPDTYTFVLRH